MRKKRNSPLDDLWLSELVEESSEIIPIITDDDEEVIDKFQVPDVLPILPIRNTVLFPGVVIPITVGRDKSLKLIKEIFKKDKIIGVTSQIDPNTEDPDISDLYKTGTVAQIVRILEMPDESTSVIIQGKKRFEIDHFITEDPYFSAKVNVLEEIKPKENDKEYSAIISSLKDFSLRIIKLSSNIPPEATFAVKNITNPTFLVNFIASNSDAELEERQKLLEEDEIKKRATKLFEYLVREFQMLELKNEVQTKVKTSLDQQQREFLLNQQMKTIQDELGGSPIDQEIEDMKKKAI